MRLGVYPCQLVEGSLASQAYGRKTVDERHRHRFEFNNSYREALESVVNNLHNQFVDAVSSGRSLDRDFVLSLADGRVFTGEQAYELGLVDTLGTLDDAVSLAGHLANLEAIPERIYPEKKRYRLLDYFFNELEERAYGVIQTLPLFLWKLEN